jgi:superfamily II DNA/RNA helicase
MAMWLALRVAQRGMSRGSRTLSGAVGSQVFAEEGISVDDLGLHDEVSSQLANAGISRPTFVQAECSSLIARPGAQDVVLLAETGAGKTLAYLVPAIDQLYTRGGPEAVTKPLVVVLAPTQDLVLQVASVVREAFPRVAPFTRCAYANVGPPRSDSFGVLVATPRALRENVHPSLLEGMEVLVLDEADMLLSGGFAEDTRGRDGVLTSARGSVNPPQVVFCAATLPSRGKKSVGAFLERFYPRATVVSSEGLHRTRSNVQISWMKVQVDEALFDRAAAMRCARRDHEVEFGSSDGRPVTGVALALHEQRLAHLRERRLWDTKLWTALTMVVDPAAADSKSECPTVELTSDDVIDVDHLGVPMGGMGVERTAAVAPTLVFVRSTRRVEDATAFFKRYGE